jgi:hypothetical protein
VFTRKCGVPFDENNLFYIKNVVDEKPLKLFSTVINELPTQTSPGRLIQFANCFRDSVTMHPYLRGA